MPKAIVHRVRHKILGVDPKDNRLAKMLCGLVVAWTGQVCPDDPGHRFVLPTCPYYHRGDVITNCEACFA